MKKRKIWLNEEVEYLRENYGKISAKELAAYFGVSTQAIVDKCRKSGISAKENRGEYWTKEEDDLLKTHFEYAPKHYIEKLFPNRTWTSITQRGVKTLNLNRKSQDRLSVNYNFFEKWTPESAYIYGFILADGYIKYKYGKQKTTCLEFELADYDSDILYKIKDALEYEGEVKFSKRNTCKLAISNTKIVEDLIKKGISTENKTFESSYPSTLPDELANHFIRGVFDGDGTIYYRDLNSPTYDVTLKLMGTKNLLSSIKDIISKKFNVKNISIIDQNKYNSNVYTFTIKSNETLKIFDWMYEGSTIHLDRKYNKYKDYKKDLF